MRRGLSSVVLLGLVLGLVPGPAGAAPSAWLTPPVDGPVVRPFEAPASAYGPGHRGIDYRVPPGTQVRAAGSGVVRFAGDVAGVTAVTIDHGGGIESTYTRLQSLEVARGQHVTRGEYIGLTGEAHPGRTGLHLGVKVDGDYVDPRTVMGPLGVADAIHLAPVSDTNAQARGPRMCRLPAPVGSDPPPPNDNLAVAVAGIGSHTKGGVVASIYDHGPEHLGYPKGRVYRFSYRGTRGPRLHRPYPVQATGDDIRDSARKLASLLEALARRRPGRDVDLIAHSQGGVVARAFLELDAGPYSARLPHVDHIVTFSAPNSGAPLAGDARAMETSSTGRLLEAGLSLWARAGGPTPDPGSAAVRQLAPGSGLMDSLASHDVEYGTRVLSLGMPTDWIVPADRARWDGKYSRTVGPSLTFHAHSDVVTSAQARATAYAFLRDAPQACAGAWDAWGPPAARALGALESLMPVAVEAATPW